MKKIRITVMRMACYKDLMEEYENPMEHACDMHVGQVFIANGWENGKIGVCCYIKRAEESVRYTHSVVFILHWISINYGMPYIGFRFKIGACCYTCVKRYQTSIRNRSMLLQS